MLGEDEGMSSGHVEMARDILRVQGITNKQRLRTDDLTISDEKLKECRFNEAGLRTAILAVIKSIQNKTLN